MLQIRTFSDIGENVVTLEDIISAVKHSQSMDELQTKIDELDKSESLLLFIDSKHYLEIRKG